MRFVELLLSSRSVYQLDGAFAFVVENLYLQANLTKRLRFKGDLPSHWTTQIDVRSRYALDVIVASD